VGVDRTVDVLTRRLDGDTLVDILLDNRLTLEDCLVRLQLPGVCDEGRIRDGFVSVCVDTSPHTKNDTKTGLETHPHLI
jgi:hypothetical protein